LGDADLRAYPGSYQPAFQKIWAQLGFGLYSDAIGTANSIAVPEFRNIMIKMIQATYAVRFNTEITGKPDGAMELLRNFEDSLNHLPAQSRWNTPMRHVRDRCREILALKGERLAEMFPGDALVRYKAGLWKLEVHKYSDAISHLRVATESPRLAQSMRGKAFRELGVALMKSGDVANAEAPLQASLVQSPPDFQAYCALSDLYRRTGRVEEAAHAEIDCRNRTQREGLAQ
jgi:tetratricopeptide (TPR) repeat protein